MQTYIIMQIQKTRLYCRYNSRHSSVICVAVLSVCLLLLPCDRPTPYIKIAILHNVICTNETDNNVIGINIVPD